MNWEAIGAVGEILGAVGVVVTLAYLARQIHVSNRAARRAAEQELMDLTFALMSQIGANADVAQLWSKGLLDFDNLSSSEQVRFHTLAYQMMALFERFFYLNRTGEVDRYIAEPNAHTRRAMVAAPGLQAWFSKRKSQFGDEFCRVLVKEMAEGGEFRLYREGEGDVKLGEV